MDELPTGNLLDYQSSPTFLALIEIGMPTERPDITITTIAWIYFPRKVKTVF